MLQIKSASQFHELINQEKPVMAVFKTTWCKDCHYIEPFMPELMERYGDRLAFAHIDRDELPDVCEQLNILGIPSFIGFCKGQELTRFVSKLRKTKEEIEQFLERTAQVAEAMVGAE